MEVASVTMSTAVPLTEAEQQAVAAVGTLLATRLGEDDLTALVAGEAAAQGLGSCELVEAVRYGMTFLMWDLRG